ncbi:hypothetical protein HGRIS_007168 [Hohenbuehelia grisea]|uniref:Uncharacterized protein n=1 Tax=Hohenbuehelia grisea TaxID=104357 RepID=A0ABR3JBM0_9AGAR
MRAFNAIILAALTLAVAASPAPEAVEVSSIADLEARGCRCTEFPGRGFQCFTCVGSLEDAKLEARATGDDWCKCWERHEMLYCRGPGCKPDSA